METQQINKPYSLIKQQKVTAWEQVQLIETKNWDLVEDSSLQTHCSNAEQYNSPSLF